VSISSEKEELATGAQKNNHDSSAFDNEEPGENLGTN
jgi:hypothetical protein